MSSELPRFRIAVLHERRVRDIVSLAYRAAVDPGGWTPFLAQCGQSLNASVSTFLCWRRDTCLSTLSATAGPSSGSELECAYNRYYAALNPWMLNARPFMRPGGITLSHVTCPTDELLRTEFFHDFGRRFEVGYGIGACLLESDGLYAHMSITRSLRAGPCGATEVRFIESLMPHLQRAVQMHSLLTDRRTDRSADVDGLDTLHTGVLVVSDSGQVHFANTAARRVLVTRDGLADDGSGLRALLPTETRSLRALIAAAARCVRGETLHAGGLIRVSRPFERPPLAVLVAPTSPARQYPGMPAGFVTVLVSPPDRPADELTLLMCLYGLTRAEARLVERLLAGQSLAASADQLGITTETARTHLKAIFRKTRTNRQSELVKVAATGVAAEVAVAQREDASYDLRENWGTSSPALGRRRAI